MNGFQFLKARDPSIIQTVKSSKTTQICGKKLFPLLCETQTSVESTAIEETEDEINGIEDEKFFKVYLRLKPQKNGELNKVYSIDKNSFVCRVPAGKNPLLRVGHTVDKIEKRFCFDKIFDGWTDQSTIFNECIKENVLHFINGHNSTLMSYGASGSGKTHTMLGSNVEPGLIPRSLEYVFKTLPSKGMYALLKPLPDGSLQHLDGASCVFELNHTRNVLNCFSKQERENYGSFYKLMQDQVNDVAILPKSTDNIFSVWVTFYEVYNESIYDLLTTDQLKKNEKQPSLRLGRNSDGNTFIRDLTCLNVQSGEEAYILLQYGMHKIKYAETLVNKHSSRSHCIFGLRLVQSDRNGDHAQLSLLNFCDLAGSERTKNTRNAGDRLVESKNINSSLHVLGRCLNIIHDKQKGVNKKSVVPYRQSKLTQIFKKALSGRETITMMINVNPTIEMFDITQHVLSFAAIAKSIIVIPEEPKPSTRRISKFQEYRKQNTSLENHSISAILHPIQPCNNDSQIELLLDENASLKQALLEKDMVLQRVADMVRDEVCKEYRGLLNEQQEFWEKRVAEAEEIAVKRERLNSVHNEANVDWKQKYNALKRNYDEMRMEYDETKISLENEIDRLKEILEHANTDYELVVAENHLVKAKYIDAVDSEVVHISDSENSSDSEVDDEDETDSENEEESEEEENEIKFNS